MSNTSITLRLQTVTVVRTADEITLVQRPSTVVTAVGSSVSGPVGPQGATGPQGAQGVTGAQGVAGAQGPQGVAGSQGAQGTQGVQGAVGSQGPQGFQGVNGAQGTQGVQGAVGSQGPQGTQGVQGAVGAQGAAGAAGAAGAQGPQGAAGAAGPQGSAGAQGSQGAAGPQGSAGPQGAAGSQGAAGAQGSQGSQGSQGVGVATGGTTNQFLVKNSATNFDTGWSSSLVANSADVTAANASSVPVTVNGVASQTANLTEWKNSSGGVLAALSPIGMMQFSGASAFVVALYADAGGPSVGWGTSSSFDNYGRMDVSSGMLRILGVNDGLLVTRSTNGVVERVRGVSGQTSDLQQWQNSSGTVLARVDANGRFVSTQSSDDDDQSILANQIFS